jgi:HPt (histidine-containing phosphotransfer) domain-containing protein
MVQAASKLVEPTPVLPAAIDRAHLARMTLGDRTLEREILQLFDRQTDTLLARMCDSEPESLKTLAHTLKGSAAGVGAGAVAKAAAALEHVTGVGERDVALVRLAAAISAARKEIAALLKE